MIFWRWPAPLISGRLISRYERFIAEVQLDSGQKVKAHCVNPGRMEGLVIPGARVWLSEQPGAARSLRLTWELVEQNGRLVGANTGLPNRLVETLLIKGLLSGFEKVSSLSREHRLGPGHVVDFEARIGRRAHLIEVKNAHLVYPDGAAYFPDSKSERATRHAVALAKHARRGTDVTIVFTVLRADAQSAKPSELHAPDFALALRKAATAGVALRAVRLVPSLEGFDFDAELPVDLSAVNLEQARAWSSTFDDTTGWRRHDGGWAGRSVPPARSKKKKRS